MRFKVVKSGGSKRAGFASLGEGLLSGAHLSLAFGTGFSTDFQLQESYAEPPFQCVQSS